MTTYVDKLDAGSSDFDDYLVSPSSMYTQINDMIAYVTGIADTSKTQLAIALDDLSLSIKDFTYTAPTVPDEIAISFNWLQGTYTSEMWTTLYNKVHADMTGGIGLSQIAYDAILARELEARRVSDERTYRKGLDNVGSRGFDLPSGQIAAMELEFARDLKKKDADALNLILIKDYDLAIENTRFAITTGKELEQLAQETFQKAEAMSLEAAKAMQEYLIQVYTAAVSLFDSKWEGVKASVSAYTSKAALEEKVAEARASVAVQALASALGAINTSMSHGYSGSESQSASWAHNQSISNTLNESHSFEEEVK